MKRRLLLFPLILCLAPVAAGQGVKTQTDAASPRQFDEVSHVAHVAHVSHVVGKEGRVATINSDGHIIAGGIVSYETQIPGAYSPKNITLLKLSMDGELLADRELDFSRSDGVRQLASDSSGNIYGAGGWGETHPLLFKVDRDLEPVPTFGVDGVLLEHGGGDETSGFFEGLLLQPSRILVWGATGGERGRSWKSYTTDGDFDLSWGWGGKFSTSFRTPATGGDFHRFGDGSVVSLTAIEIGQKILKFDRDGRPARSFPVEGVSPTCDAQYAIPLVLATLGEIAYSTKTTVSTVSSTRTLVLSRPYQHPLRPDSTRCRKHQICCFFMTAT